MVLTDLWKIKYKWFRRYRSKLKDNINPQNIYISRPSHIFKKSRPSHIFKDVLANDGEIAGRVKDNQRQFCPK